VLAQGVGDRADDVKRVYESKLFKSRFYLAGPTLVQSVDEVLTS